MTQISNSLQTVIDEFFTFNVATEPKVIIFIKDITNRFKFTCDFIFKQSLKINYIITDNETEFLQSVLAKINYSDKAFDNSAKVVPHGLLSETEIRKIKIEHIKRDGTIRFFNTSEDGFGYDIFTSVFYFISRYEEWLPYFGDKHGRFEPRATIFYFLSIYKKPVVDQWVMEFKNHLQKLFPKLIFPEKKFRSISTIDVDNVYAFKGKPLSRAIGANIRDFLSLNFESIISRFKTRYFLKSDPFDSYDLQMELSQKYQIPLIYFFLYRHNTKFDRTIDPEHPEFIKLLKKVTENNITAGIHPSYLSSNEPGLFKEETELLRKNSGQDVVFSRQHYLRFDIRKTADDLSNIGIKYDFSMGYAVDVGFKAGTCLPFYFFDLNSNTQKQLLTVPFCVMDGAFYNYLRTQPKEAEKEINDFITEIKNVNGLFVSVFHDRTFSETTFPGWKALYIRLQEKLKAE